MVPGIHPVLLDYRVSSRGGTMADGFWSEQSWEANASNQSPPRLLAHGVPGPDLGDTGGPVRLPFDCFWSPL